MMSTVIALCIGNFAMAQTQSSVKKATLMPEGSQVVDLKTGEILRTNKGGVSISNISLTEPINLERTGAAKNQNTGEGSKRVNNTSDNFINRIEEKNPKKSNN